MIAMAISCNPDVLIADEPTTALDVTVQKNILNLLKEIQTQRNMGMIFISHDLGIIKNIANQVLVMQKGTVVEKGTTSEIFNNPQHVYTKALISCKPPLDKRFEQLPIVQDFINNPSGDFIRESNPQNRILQHQKIYQASPILQVQNLSVYYPNQTNFWGKTTSFVKAVNEVSFEVYPGETLGLIGESGCGKTTIGRAIVGLQEITHGNIIFKDKNIKDFNVQDWKDYRKSVQIIFQDPYSSLNPRLNIGKAIQEPIAFYNKNLTENELKQKVEYLLQKVGLLPEHYNRYPHEFSGGQRQRISIARTLALEPKFIICDESVSALDVSVQAQVLNVLSDLKKDFGLSYIFISHDLSVIKYMCDRMVVLNKNGELEEVGECDAIYANPSSQYTQKLINSIPV
jgi:peptide/nickel transport system ATP-binding protein